MNPCKKFDIMKKKWQVLIYFFDNQCIQNQVVENQLKNNIYPNYTM